MNIFLPYENDINKSIQSLDDVRLNKQIVEIKQLINIALKDQYTLKSNGYHNHPIYKHYKDYLPFMCLYGYRCSQEMINRFIEKNMEKGLKKSYSLDYFRDLCFEYVEFNEDRTDWKIPKYVPYYMEGSKGQSNYIRTFDNVSKLFQDKLNNKWEQDRLKGRKPKWTNRKVPEFYEEL